jgi:hypothetical protein
MEERWIDLEVIIERLRIENADGSGEGVYSTPLSWREAAMKS